MGNALKLQAARKVYRNALEVARASPSLEAWARLLAAGKELSLVETPSGGRTNRRGRSNEPTITDVEAVEELATNDDSAALRGAGQFGE